MQKSNESIESATRMIKTIIENCEDILRVLPDDNEDCLPVWWTNKLAISSAYIDSLRDYISYSDIAEDESDDESDEDDSEDSFTEETVEDEYYMLPPSVRMVRNAS